MSFLTRLLTLEKSLEEGQQLITLPRTLRSYIFGNDKPHSYKAHKTKGGLYLVLPHNQDSSLFRGYPTKNFERKLFDQVPLSSFYVQETQIRRGKKASLYSSMLSRSVAHPETQTEMKVSVSYDVGEDAVPVGLRIHYTMILEESYYRNVSFEVSLNRATGNIHAFGPVIQTNFKYKTSSLPVNYEATLENLVDLLSVKDLGPEQFSPLINGAYVQRHTLH